MNESDDRAITATVDLAPAPGRSGSVLEPPAGSSMLLVRAELQAAAVVSAVGAVIAVAITLLTEHSDLGGWVLMAPFSAFFAWVHARGAKRYLTPGAWRTDDALVVWSAARSARLTLLVLGLLYWVVLPASLVLVLDDMGGTVFVAMTLGQAIGASRALAVVRRSERTLGVTLYRRSRRADSPGGAEPLAWGRPIS